MMNPSRNGRSRAIHFSQEVQSNGEDGLVDEMKLRCSRDQGRETREVESLGALCDAIGVQAEDRGEGG